MGVLGYGRYDDDPEHVGCPRATSDMTPCIARDGRTALADDQTCVGCGADPHATLGEMRQAARGALEWVEPYTASPNGAADALAILVREATAPDRGGEGEA